MKKIVICLAFFAIFATGTVFADHPGGFGIGVQGGFGGVGAGGALTLKFPSMPIFWAVDFYFGESNGAIEVIGDYYFIDNRIASIFHWYLGVGGYVGLWAGSNNLSLWAGARLPIGLSIQPLPLLEIYLQVVPRIGLSILPDIGLHGNFWGGNIGIRLWF